MNIYLNTYSVQNSKIWSRWYSNSRYRQQEMAWGTFLYSQKYVYFHPLRCCWGSRANHIGPKSVGSEPYCPQTTRLGNAYNYYHHRHRHRHRHRHHHYNHNHRHHHHHIILIIIVIIIVYIISIIVIITGLILGLQPANETRRYKVTPPFIGWAQNLESALLLLLVMVVIVVGVVKHVLLLC